MKNISNAYNIKKIFSIKIQKDKPEHDWNTIKNVLISHFSNSRERGISSSSISMP